MTFNTNQEYWEGFYRKKLAPTSESDFARFSLKLIEESRRKNLIDIGCGNGRDLFYFLKNGINAFGIDMVKFPIEQCDKFILSNVMNFNYEPFDIFYMRFFVHSIKESEFDELIKNIKSNKKEGIIFIETRSSKGITDDDRSETYFKSCVGDEHFRMLYSKKYLTGKLANQFDITYIAEDAGFASFGNEDPVCIRCIAKVKS